MSDQAQPQRGGWLKAAVVGLVGLGGGAAGTYGTALLDRVAKPTRPVANFAVAGLTVVCQNRASGDSGWWDFGDGTALEPFDAGQPEQKHTYTKPGNYTVKLTVRNFVSDENERSVPVEVAAAAAPATPAVLDFAVRPVSAVSVVPAMFRVTAEVKNADNCVWDFGDGRLEVAEAGKIDRLVTFEWPLPAGLTGMTGWDRRYQLGLTQGGRPLLNGVVSLPWSGVLAATDDRRWGCSITPETGRVAVSVNPLQ